MLILFRGLPTSGKTTLSCALAQRLSLAVFDRDILKATALWVFGDDHKAGILSYHQLCALVNQQFRLGVSVIVDAPFSKPAELEAVVDVARAK